MSLYKPPLLLKSQRNISTHSEIKGALEELSIDYFYSGKRSGKSNYIEIAVCSVIRHSVKDLFLKSCYYSGERQTWKKVIKDQILNHLLEIGIETGFARSEVRYFEVTPDQYMNPEEYERRLKELMVTINREKEG